ncbi:hypothetical protein [Paenibacillus sp. GCM10012303]|jgi:hypothetical protein|uniref:hypothetical protein n=1 Tax=Paenibacillus sp. GCM10012303 TaxID=3317340 RepID=UPI003607F52B
MNRLLARLVFVLLFVAAIVGSGMRQWSSAERRDRIVYGSLMLPVLYLGIIFVTEARWPNIDTLFHSIFAGPAKRIVDLFQPGG